MRTTPRRRRLGAVSTAVVALAAAPLATAAVPAGAAPAAPAGPAARYIVQLASAPVASYAGGTGSFARTKPGNGQKVNRVSPAARAYAAKLRSDQTSLLRQVGAGDGALRRSYTVALNGFAATLTPGQVAQLRRSPQVLHVWKDEVRTADTVSTPAFLGLTGPNGVWQKQLGGPSKAGAGMIVGVVDSGIWPENPSFAATSQSAQEAQTIAAKWKGRCDAGNGGVPVRCNNKLIGAQFFKDNATVEPFEFDSPRDYHGHGSHTAGTAAGNRDVTAVINGANVGKASGMAPQARIATYKALWGNTAGSASGSTSDLVAAIDTAVGDGVDVINYSISGSRDYVVSADEMAFLGAADGGVFVATSAGNSGDTVGTSSVAHNAPWTMTVAASTHDRGVSKPLTLGNGKKLTGVGVGGGVGPKPLVTSTAVALPGVPAEAVRLCFADADQNPANGAQPVLDPAKTAGKIVVCDRGVNARTDKSAAVKTAGGVGMVLTNTAAAQSLDADFHPIPVVHLDAASGAQVKAYAATAGATATIGATATTKARAPEMAGFSSFGPALAGNGDLLKPDITAPGSAIIAPVAPPNNQGNTWSAYSGTSMSTPHIAGIAALIKQKHPEWSFSAVKSAMMTSATTLDNQRKPIQRAGRDATPLDHGSGHVVPAKAFSPGLVYQAGYSDWLRYACAIGQLQLVNSGACNLPGRKDPSDLNYPSIAVGDLAGTQTITRTVTNVEGRDASYTADVQAPAGYTATVTPDVLSVPAGQSRTFQVTLTRTTAAFGQWSFGSLTWKGSRGQSVRSPIAVRGVAAAAPTEVRGTGVTGSTDVTVTAGFSGTMTTAAAGLVPSAVQTKTATPGASASFTVTVPAGTEVARFATFDADYAAGTDLDLTVKLNGREVGTSGGGTAEEAVTLQDPQAGTYTVEVDLFSGAASLPVKLHSFVVGSAAAGNLTATPATQQVALGRPVTVKTAWKGLTAGQRYLGLLSYLNGSTEAGRTIVSVVP